MDTHQKNLNSDPYLDQAQALIDAEWLQAGLTPDDLVRDKALMELLDARAADGEDVEKILAEWEASSEEDMARLVEDHLAKAISQNGSDPRGPYHPSMSCNGNAADSSRIPGDWDELLAYLRRLNRASGEFATVFVIDVADDWRKVIRSNVSPGLWGTYLMRNCLGKVVYVGKGGTLYQSGDRSSQDLLERLCNTRKEAVPELVKRYGSLGVEYFVLNQCPLIPHFVESALLQAHVAKFNCLPDHNTCF